MRSIRNTVAAIVVLAAATVWAQSTSPAAAPNVPLAGTRAAAARKSESRMVNPSSPGAMHQRMDEMQGTLDKMHALLKQMRAKAAASASKNSLTEANLDMWELMVGELDKQFEHLKTATLARDDMEARRAAMYKQASDKADAEAAAHRAQAAAAFERKAAGNADQGASPASGNQAAPQTGAGQVQPSTPAPAAAPQQR